MKKEINYVCSLGSYCMTASFLKSHNLKKASYPFDWIFIPVDGVIDVFRNWFSSFLNKGHYNNISDEDRIKYYHLTDKHRVAGHKYHHTMFWHRDPLNNPKDYNYYLRTVQRMNNLSKKDENKLFIMFDRNYDGKNHNYEYESNSNNKNSIKNKINYNLKFELDKYFRNYTLLYIFINDYKEHNYEIETYENITYLDIDLLSGNNGFEFNDKSDDIYLMDTINSLFEFKLKNVENITKVNEH